MHGYLNAMPLRSDVFDDVLSGKRLDNSITPTDILSYTDGCSVDLYLMSIAVRPDSRHIGQGIDQAGLHRLMYGLKHRLETLFMDHGIRVKRLGAVAWKPEGQRLCEFLGMEPHGEEHRKHPAYLLDLGQPIRRRAALKFAKQLQQLYS